mmetsp:Transcript_2930/g.5185  ORF Transcript_2930/g.5185 Transcript_2930/m.5185 type:complete len:175 (+) Transcript_2930:80-604(+)
MVYHSALNDFPARIACGCAILPLKTNVRGPAGPADAHQDDIIDEAIRLFRANCLFRSFEVAGPADRVLIYVTLYINTQLRKIQPTDTKESASKIVLRDGLDANFSLPGEAGFPFGGVFPSAKESEESDLIRAYLRQLREETGKRLITAIVDPDGRLNKHWLAYGKRKFLNKTLP